jgi:signal transduction histidine kinase/ligand-binding sensor protein
MPGHMHPPQPSQVHKLTELIDEDVLRLLQRGLSDTLGMSVALVYLDPEIEDPRYVPAAGLERGGQWAPFCRTLRGQPQGDALCKACDFQHFRALTKSADPKLHQYPCHAGIIDFMVPITVDGWTMGAFVTGQVIERGGEAEVRAHLPRLAARVPGLEEGKLLAALDSPEMRIAGHEELAEISGNLETLAGHVSTIANTRYQLMRRERDREFGDWIASQFGPNYDREESLWTTCPEVLREVRAYFGLAGICLLSDLGTDGTRLRLVAEDGCAHGLPSEFEVLPSVQEVVDRMPDGQFLPALDPKCLALWGSLQEGSWHGRWAPEALVAVTPAGATHHLAAVIYRTVPVGPSGGDTMEDSHAFRQLAASLSDAVAVLELREANIITERYVEYTAHDIHSGLAGLLAEADFLQSLAGGAGVIDAELITDSVQKINDEMTRLIRKCRANLTVVSAHKSKQLFYPTKQSIAPLIHAESASCRRRAEAAKLRISVSPEIDKLLEFPFALEPVEALVAALLDNALKYSVPGTEVSLTGRCDGARVYVSASNIGPEIPLKARRTIFDPYVRAVGLDAEHFTWGSGLGLAAAKAIVDMHGGKIEATCRRLGQSEAPAGAPANTHLITFTFWLPLRPKVDDSLAGPDGRSS